MSRAIIAPQESTARQLLSFLFVIPLLTQSADVAVRRILDECTSAVSREMEQRLYDICTKLQITYVTISHRPALLAYHDQLLSIGDGKCGFTLSNIDRHAHAVAVSKLTAASIVDKDTESSIKAHLSARSARYSRMQQARSLPQRSNRARFRRLWELGRPVHLGKQLCGMCVFFACQIYLQEFRNYVRSLPLLW
eukprot:COSAG05_NODE_279_length_12322_cov_79.874744_4_plen_194_part_00